MELKEDLELLIQRANEKQSTRDPNQRMVVEVKGEHLTLTVEYDKPLEAQVKIHIRTLKHQTFKNLMQLITEVVNNPELYAWQDLDICEWLIELHYNDEALDAWASAGVIDYAS